MKRLFILGCERSGSTWLANVLDAHPAVLLLMEPFADYARLFPEMPERNTYLSNVPEELARDVARRWIELPRAKFPLFTAPRYSHALRLIGRSLLSGYARLHRPLWVRRHGLLNLNHRETANRQWPRKASRALLEVTKELRLNFKVSLLTRVFPDSRIVVSIRHPFAQIDSVLRMFDRDHLGELEKSLASFTSLLERHDRFAKYRGLDPRTRIERLAVWWLVNYEVLLEDVERWGAPCMIASNEELSDSPQQTAARLLRFAGLPDHDAVDDYLRWSSTTSGSGSALDTRRRSRQYSRLTIERGAERVEPALRAVADRLPSVHPLLQPYLAW